MILRPILQALGLVEEVVAVALLLATAAMTVLQVAGRYLMTNPFIWTEEVTRLTLIWLAYVAAAAVTRRGVHIAVDTGLNMLNPAWRRAANVLVHSVTALLFAWLAYLAMVLAFKVSGLPLAATRWSMAVMVWPTMAGCLLIAFHSLLLALSGIGMIPADAVNPSEETEVIRS